MARRIISRSVEYFVAVDAWCPTIDWIEDPDADDDESSPSGFNEDFESDCYGDGEDEE